MKLYHYVHCPFCVRVRMALGYLKVEYESIVLPYDDEATPLSLTGVKMLPILEFSSADIRNESLDIISILDKENLLDPNHTSTSIDEIEALLTKIGSNVHSLAMPYWIWTPEFDQKSREYFQSKKEKKRGPFKDLIPRQKEFILNLNNICHELSSNLMPFYKSKQLSLYDIMIASHLWGMYIVPEYQFDQKIHTYLQRIKETCFFDYHGDFWK